MKAQEKDVRDSNSNSEAVLSDGLLKGSVPNKRGNKPKVTWDTTVVENTHQRFKPTDNETWK